MRLNRFFPVIFSAMLLSACASMFDAKPRIDLIGDPAAPSAATRTVVINPDTQYVNVVGGEIIRFVVGNKAFAWNFDSAQRIAPFDLSLIAPGSTLDHRVTVYVARNPLYLNDRERWWW